MILRAGLLAGLVLAGLVLAGLVLAGPAEAGPEPSELPPPDYAGQQYVDSRGCLFLRAGYGGQTLWVPRVTRGGQPLCGYPPSGQGLATDADPAPAPGASP
jgi:hypothetical protein